MWRSLPMKVYDLVQEYYNSLCSNGTQQKGDYSTVSNMIEKSLRSGWSQAQILRAIKTRHPKAVLIKDILYPRENMVLNNEIYYHSELRIVPPHPRSKIDEVTGNVVYVNLDEEWKLEMVKTYTLYNLLKYYYNIFKIKYKEHEVKRDVGAMKYMLNSYSIDQLLFIIDSAWGYITDIDAPNPKSPFDIQAYTREGLSVYEDKIAHDRAVGVIGEQQCNSM